MESGIKIPNPKQISFADQFTISNEPISSIDLMERASQVFVKWFTDKIPNRGKAIKIFSGPGNNGGDGLAIARLLKKNYYKVEVYFYGNAAKSSADCKKNLDKFKKSYPNSLFFIEKIEDFPHIETDDILIDALLGSGLSRPLEGRLLEVVKKLNDSGNTITSVDIPTGLFADSSTDGVSIHASHTLSFEFPKLSFFMAENENRIKNWEYRSIGLHLEGIKKIEVNNFLVTDNMVAQYLPERTKFSHKGSYGRVLILAGKYGFAGAAVLTSKACMRSGTGLIFIRTPKKCVPVLQTAFPEAICLPDEGQMEIESLPDLNEYDSIGCGPGIGKSAATQKAILKLLDHAKCPIVLDADALNIIAENNWQDKIPKNAVLTPHPGEFSRLFGSGKNDFEVLENQRAISKKLGIYIVFKGAHSRLSTPEGNIFFNHTGNPGMATAGSGDVLTGIITSFLGQGISPFNAVLLATYLHGKAGDLAAKKWGFECLLASDIVDELPGAFKSLHNVN